MTQPSNLTQLKKHLNVNSLLTNERANPKVAKSEKLGILTGVLHLAPADLSGYEVCPMRSAGCTAACLHTAGNPAYLANKNEARIKRTKAFFEHREAFMNLLVLEMAKHIESAAKQKMEPAFRLNGTSDIVWEKTKFNLWPWVGERVNLSSQNSTVLDLFSDIQVYDYTKRYNRKNLPDNYHLTFSLNEENQKHALAMLEAGTNVAVVFQGKLPSKYLGYEVIDGDIHDYRPQDPSPVIVGLKAKGKARSDDSGFTILL